MNYLLMNKNMPVLEFSYDEETHAIQDINNLIHTEYAPLGIKDYKTGITKKLINKWWRDRAIPSSRYRIRCILDELDISSSVELLKKCLGLSLSDQYWIKEKESAITWKDINFFEHDFSEDMGKLLMEQMEYSHDMDIFSPDNSSDGNLKKKWKIIDGKRCLIKGGTFLNQEPFNEVIATKLYERILKKEEYVPYTLIKENGHYYSCCETMIKTDQELVPAYYINKTKELRGSNFLYEHFISTCEDINIPLAKQRIDKMIVCDYIIANYDRHYRNFGAIRNVETLEWIGIAPIYDNGSSLWATTLTRSLGTDYKSKPFKSNPEAQLQLVDDLSWLNVENLKGFEDVVAEILHKSPYIEPDRINKIKKLVKNRISDVIERKIRLENTFSNSQTK